MLSEDVGNFRALEACVDPCLDKPCRPLLIKLAHGPIHSVYLFAEDGLKRISQRVMMGLVHGKDSMPQYAGTKQKVADIILEADNGKPIERSVRSFLRFDESGQVHRDLVVSGFAALDTGLALEAALRKRSGKVVDLAPKLYREKWERENRWTLSKEDLDLIGDDIWGRKTVASPKKGLRGPLPGLRK